MVQSLMRQIQISKFKATCLAVLEDVQRTGEPVLVTRFGQPIAKIVADTRPERPMGSMVGTGKILGDIISPAFDESDWDALK